MICNYIYCDALAHVIGDVVKKCGQTFFRMPNLPPKLLILVGSFYITFLVYRL